MNVFEKIREKLEELCEQTYYNSVNGNRDDGIRNNAYHNAVEIVNQVEQKHNNGWIPCSEGLPEESGEYLTWVSYDNNDFIAIDEIDCDGIIKKWNCTYKVIAWQPLPQPYKESDTNGN